MYDKKDNLYDLGDKVLAYVFPYPRHESEVWLPGIITRLLGKIEMVPGQRDSIQHKYEISLNEGGIVQNFERYIIPNPLERKISH